MFQATVNKTNIKSTKFWVDDLLEPYRLVREIRIRPMTSLPPFKFIAIV
jgi:hypothetical protein